MAWRCALVHAAGLSSMQFNAVRCFVSAMEQHTVVNMHAFAVIPGHFVLLLKPVCCKRQPMIDGRAPVSRPGSFGRALPCFALPTDRAWGMCRPDGPAGVQLLDTHMYVD